jgi:hypothetical protein
MFQERQQDLLTLKALVEAGKVTPVIDRTCPLADTAAAIRYLEQGHEPSIPDGPATPFDRDAVGDRQAGRGSPSRGRSARLRP